MGRRLTKKEAQLIKRIQMAENLSRHKKKSLTGQVISGNSEAVIAALERGRACAGSVGTGEMRQEVGLTENPTVTTRS